MAQTEVDESSFVSRTLEAGFERRYWVLGISGVLAFLISFLLEESFELIKANTIKLQGSDQFWSRVLGYFVHLLAQFSMEVAFACAIGLILGIFIERVAHLSQQGFIERALHLITKNVLKEAYSVTTPKPLVTLAISAIQQPVIRKDHKMTFTLRSTIIDLNGQPKEHKLLIVESDALLENTSGRTIKHEVRLQIPTRREEALRQQAVLTGGLIAGKTLDANYIAEGDAGAQDTEYERKYLWTCELKPGESVRVLFNYQVIKDDSDNEVWTSLLPSFPPEVVVDMQCPNLEWDIDGLFQGSFTPLDGQKGVHGAGRTRFTAPVPLLPYQGLVLWWRPRHVTVVAPPPGAAPLVSGDAPQEAT